MTHTRSFRAVAFLSITSELAKIHQKYSIPSIGMPGRFGGLENIKHNILKNLELRMEALTVV